MVVSKSPPGIQQNTISAAVVNPTMLPFDVQLSQMKDKGLLNSDTVYIDNSRVDTVYVTKVKYKSRPVVPDKPSTELIPDSVRPSPPIMVGDTISNEKVREEKATDEHIILIVNKKIVYSSENDNHSTEGEGQ